MQLKTNNKHAPMETTWRLRIGTSPIPLQNPLYCICLIPLLK